MSWETPVPIFEDEDEDELIARFVELTAVYGDKFEPFQITQEIFKNLKDPTMRANQAALVWSKDLAILERIKQARLNGGTEPKPIETKEMKLKKLEALYNNEDIGVKDRLAAMRLHAEIQGEITKAIEKTTEDRTRHFPQIVQAVYPDSRVAA